MGNHIIAERMYRYQPAVMLYAPLHTMIWQSPDGGTHFTFDRPSDQFGSWIIDRSVRREATPPFWLKNSILPNGGR